MTTDLTTDLDSTTLTAAVLESFSATTDPRTKEIFESLTRHLHDFVREVQPSIEEWGAAIDYLTATGQMCDDTRQEFILLSDVLGVSMLVETLNDAETPDATDATVLGPFHVVASPVRRLGDDVSPASDGDRSLVTGTVRSPSGEPIAGATVDVWQADTHGFYDVQQPGVQPLGNGRGLFTTDADGAFRFVTVVPSYYPIPTDGPVGALLHAAQRHPNRPAHIHFIVTAPGYEELTTHIFVAGSPYLDSDAVFAVKQSLITTFTTNTDQQAAAAAGIDSPFQQAVIDLVLQPSTVASRVVFADGAVDEVGAEAARAGLERVLVVSTASAGATAGRVAAALGSRFAGGFDQAAMHVPAAVAAQAAALATRLRADGCVAVGGGSAIGLAKALALDTGVAILAVPTTYAGSEMTPIWGRTADGTKTTGRDPRVLPVGVLYDPELSLGLPVPVSIVSGFNAVAHAVEALYAPDRSPLLDLAAEEGMRLMLSALPRIALHPRAVGARSDALTAAWLCGTVLGSTTMGLHHRICHVLGGRWNLPHAETHTVVLPHVVALFAHAAPGMAAAVRRAAGFDRPGTGLQDLARRLGAPTSLAELGLPADAVDEAAALVCERPVQHPVAVSESEVRSLLHRALRGVPAG